MNLDFLTNLNLDINLFLSLVRIAVICFASLHVLALIVLLRQVNLASNAIKTKGFGCILLFIVLHVIILFLILFLSVFIAP